jgi:nucleotide-binding universal stress UspA family protein
VFKRILVPLDRSDLAEQAVGQATAIARASKAAIDLALVHQPLPFAGFDDEPWNREASRIEQEYLATIAAQARLEADVTVSHAVLYGEATDMLCRRVQDIGADLIVMTSHGRGGLSRFWMGSVASAIVRHASAPSLVLRPLEGKPRRTSGHHLFQHILVPLDGSAYAADILPPAIALAECGGAHIVLLRVVEPVPLIGIEAGIPYVSAAAVTDDMSTQELVESARKDLGEVTRRLHAAGIVEVEAEVVVAVRVADAIIHFARSHEIDAIAMSTHGRGFSRLFMGSVADKVLRASGLPVLMRHPLGVPADGVKVYEPVQVVASA